MRAEEIRRTGILPVQAKPARAPRTPKAKVPAITLSDAQALVTSLYDRSSSDEVTYELITAEVQKLDKLTAKDLSAVAKEFGVVPGKTKKASLEAILEKITAGRRHTSATCSSPIPTNPGRHGNCAPRTKTPAPRRRPRRARRHLLVGVATLVPGGAGDAITGGPETAPGVLAIVCESGMGLRSPVPA